MGHNTPEMPPVRERIIRLAIVCGDEGCGQCRWIYDNSQGMLNDPFKCRLFGKQLRGLNGESDPFYRWTCARLPECLEATETLALS